jgi:hypothetical protein
MTWTIRDGSAMGIGVSGVVLKRKRREQLSKGTAVMTSTGLGGSIFIYS